MMAFACISIGSNIGDSSEHVNQAIQCLDKLPDSQLLAHSKLYGTKPWGRKNQADFINAAAAIETALPPLDLLDELQKVEHQHGRERATKWGPRTLDLDIICYDQTTMKHPRLVLPHAYFSQRSFVLEPLNEICPDHKIAGHSVQYWLDQLQAEDKN